jgi:hypothetical protein
VKVRAITLVFLAALSASLVLAEDFKTTDGKEYKDATVKRVEPDGIVLGTKSGISKLYFTELPKEVQRRFSYDPNKAAGYSAEQNAADEQIRKQQEGAVRQQAEQTAKLQAGVQRNTDQLRNVQALQDRYVALQQDEANLSRRVGELQKFPEHLSEHSLTGNQGGRHKYRYANPARADLPALQSQLTAVRNEKDEVEKQLKKAQH